MAKGTQIAKEQIDALIAVASDSDPLDCAPTPDPGIDPDYSRADHVHVGGLGGGGGAILLAAVYDPSAVGGILLCSQYVP